MKEFLDIDGAVCYNISMFYAGGGFRVKLFTSKFEKSVKFFREQKTGKPSRHSYILCVVLPCLILMFFICCTNKDKRRYSVDNTVTEVHHIDKIEFTQAVGTSFIPEDKADLIISVDSSETMSDDKDDVIAYMNDFLDILPDTIDLRIAVANATAPEYVVECHSYNAGLIDEDPLLTSDEIKADIDLHPDIVESPIYWGLRAVEENTATYLPAEPDEPCFRDDIIKFLFVVSDEDERDYGACGQNCPTIFDNDIDDYLGRLRSKKIHVFSATEPYPMGEVIRHISTYSWGYSFDISSGFGTIMQSLADKIAQGYTVTIYDEGEIYEPSLIVKNEDQLLTEGFHYNTDITEYKADVILVEEEMPESGQLIATFIKKENAMLTLGSELGEFRAMDYTVYKEDGSICYQATGVEKEVELDVGACVDDWSSGSWDIQYKYNIYSTGL